MANFGDLLSELRRDKKLTQDELAHILYVTSGTISNYENNVHYPDVVTDERGARCSPISTACPLSGRGR